MPCLNTSFESELPMAGNSQTTISNRYQSQVIIVNQECKVKCSSTLVFEQIVRKLPGLFGHSGVR